MTIYLSTTGGYGDSLMLSMPAKRIRQIYPEAKIVVSGNQRTIQILGSNPNIDEIRSHTCWSDIPYASPNFDVVIDFRYGVKSFFPTGEKYEFDIPIAEVERRQNETELSLWVNDIPSYRMRMWQQNLEKYRAKNYFGLGNKTNWYSIISYLSGINFTPDDLFIYTQEPVKLKLPESFIAVSSPNMMNGFSKFWRKEYWNKLFKLFPNEIFVLVGSVLRKDLVGKNMIHLEKKTSIFETAYIISKSKFLISDEGGLVHVAKAVKKKSIVLFGPTQKWFFSYSENINLRGNYNDCLFCNNQSSYWGIKCVKNTSNSPYCVALEMLKPETIAKEIDILLNFKERNG